jgi:hypothetical protein
MSEKKQLLEESTIRRFMKLANIKPLAESDKPERDFAGVSGKSARKFAGKAERGIPLREEEEEEEVKKEGYVEEGEPMYEEEDAAEPPADDAGMDMGGDMGADAGGMGDEMGAEGGDDVKAKVQALADAVNGLLQSLGKGDLEVDIDAGAGEDAGAEGDMGGEELPAEEPPAGEEEEEGAPMMEVELEEDDALAEELTRRVAARLMKEMKSGKGGWLIKKPHVTPKKAMPSHPVGKGKKAAPFNKAAPKKVAPKAGHKK